jgi:drug/metabolite transporter (DMT)-like permease
VNGLLPFLGPLCAFGSSVTWAFGSGGYSKLARDNSVYAVNFARAMVSLPLFLITAYVAAGSWGALVGSFSEVHGVHFFWLTLSMIGSYALGDVMFLLSTREIGVSVALTIASSYPLMMALWGFLFQGEALSHLQIAGLFLTVGGMATVILNTPDSPERRKVKGRGILFAFIAMACWGLNALGTAHGSRDLSMPVANSIRMAIALLLCGFFGKVIPTGQIGSNRLMLSKGDFKKWLWLFGFEGFGGAGFYMYGLAHTSLAVGAALSSVAPVLSVPVAWAFGIEKF